ncbi:hypothetical protein [Nocardioides speluncae]|uniref:hypothetical protein n=1 Tax=Nocardioides speluncae TaxID=2670337 RepID=UPI000D697CA0|nr:hypothetical protein [Nocardioides speluncae]
MTISISRPVTALLAVITAGVLVVGGYAAHAALADHNPTHVTFSGTTVAGVKIATSKTGASVTGPTWTTVPGSGVSVLVPAGKSRLLTATFGGETQCSGPSLSWCSARIVVRKSGATTPAELNPKSGAGYAMDAGNSTDNWEGHSMDRSGVIGAGSWQVYVQLAGTDGTTFYVEDWHFRVQIFNR